MDQRTKTNNHIKTPYDKYRNSSLWNIIEKELKELQDNQDIEITTHPDYVIGSLVKVVEASLFNNK